MAIFSWLRSMGAPDEPLQELVSRFGLMVGHARHSFDLATDAYLIGADAKTIEGDVKATDEKINEIHSSIRRGLVIHASLRGAGEVASALAMISVAKDAELIGDYTKHIAKLAVRCPKQPDGPFHAILLEMKGRISSILAEARELYESEDEDGARAFIGRAEALKDECDAATREILTSLDERTVQPADPAATVLCFRYYRRIVSHSLNIVTSVVLPVDHLDYYDEDKESRGPLPVEKATKRKKRRKKGKKDKKKRKKDKK
ncbi:MAG: PhoU domain-containing protein [Planctomycetota bacterium]|nr:PhoU domain-containing protein [Planctomycetota bacterium]